MGKLSENSEVSGVGLQFQIQEKLFSGGLLSLVSFLLFCISSLFNLYGGEFVAWKLYFCAGPKFITSKEQKGR